MNYTNCKVFLSVNSAYVSKTEAASEKCLKKIAGLEYMIKTLEQYFWSSSYSVKLHPGTLQIY